MLSQCQHPTSPHLGEARTILSAFLAGGVSSSLPHQPGLLFPPHCTSLTQGPCGEVAQCTPRKSKDSSLIPGVIRLGVVACVYNCSAGEAERGGSLGLAGHPVLIISLRSRRDPISKPRWDASEKEHLRWFSGPLIHAHMCIQPHIHTTIQPHIHTCVRPWVRSPMTQREKYSSLQGPEPRSSHALQALATAGFSRQVHTSLNFLTRVTRLLPRGAGDGIWGLPQPFGSLSKAGSCFRGSGGWSYWTQRIVVTEKSGSHWSGQAEALQASAFCHYVYQSFIHSADLADICYILRGCF